MKKLDEKELIKSAKAFCKQESGKYRKELFGVTDGKAVGTFVEHLFQNYLSKNYEMEVGIQDVVGCLVVQHTDEQGDYALHDECITLCLEVNLPFGCEVCLQPNSALATINEVALHFVLFGQRFLFTAEVDEHLIFVHPIIETFKLFDDLLLYFFYRHCSVHITSSMVCPTAFSVSLLMFLILSSKVCQVLGNPPFCVSEPITSIQGMPPWFTCRWSSVM